MLKKIFRMVIFSGISLYLTGLWNKGFMIKPDPKYFLISALIVAGIYYLVVPVAKVILFPLNLLTLGILPTLIYFFLFYFFTSKYAWVNVKEWTFPGINIGLLIIHKTSINSFVNVILSAVSVSTFINLLEFIL